MELLEDRYVTNLPGKVTFGVSSQHYTFTENAFVELVKRFGQERYAFYYNETGTHQILDDVKNRVCDLGILYLSHENEVVMRKVIEENHLVFTELFSAKPHVFLQKDHPLASKKVVSVHDLAPYPRLNFVQGEYESVYFSQRGYCQFHAWTECLYYFKWHFPEIFERRKYHLRSACRK